MKLILITDKQSDHSFFEQLKKDLESEVLGLDLSEEQVAFPADLPFSVQKHAAEHEAVFVFSELESSIKHVIMNKLIDIEMNGNIVIIKALETKTAEEDVDKPETDEEKANHYSELIIHSLFRDKE
jgi:hypothetical protein